MEILDYIYDLLESTKDECEPPPSSLVKSTCSLEHGSAIVAFRGAGESMLLSNVSHDWPVCVYGSVYIPLPTPRSVPPTSSCGSSHPFQKRRFRV
mmetsp:Transcript_8839/g.23970  ORF Transcript_8839/g.23970 Transcript_8839/m.23970 type:complete len:95 (+) Transcript_8839:314-598(+)